MLLQESKQAFPAAKIGVRAGIKMLGLFTVLRHTRPGILAKCDAYHYSHPAVSYSLKRFANANSLPEGIDGIRGYSTSVQCTRSLRAGYCICHYPHPAVSSSLFWVFKSNFYNTFATRRKV